MALVTLANKGNLEQTIKRIETELDHVMCDIKQMTFSKIKLCPEISLKHGIVMRTR